MEKTTYYNLNIVEGTDIVNPLVVDNPNYEKIDDSMHTNAVNGVTLATEIANARVHALTRANSECAVIRFIATSNWMSGDTMTVDGVTVTTQLPSGESLPDGAYVINANVLCILTGTNLTVYAGGKNTDNANDITYKDTNVADALDTINSNYTNVTGTLDTINSNLSGLLLVEQTTITISTTLAPNTAYNDEGSVTPQMDGYTAIGIVGATSNNGYISFTKARINEQGDINFCVVNPTNTSYSIGNFYFDVLYMKNL